MAATHLSFDPYLHHAWPAAQIPLVAANLNSITGGTNGYVDQMAVVVEEANLSLDDNDLVMVNSIDLVQIADRISNTKLHPAINWNLAEQKVLDFPDGVQSGGFAQNLIAGSLDPVRLITLPSEIDALNLPPIVGRQMRADLQNGFEVLLLKNDGSAWLSRDIATGAWIGRGLDGRGDATETGVLNAEIMKIEGVSIFVELVFCIGGAITSADPGGSIAVCLSSTALNVASLFSPFTALASPFIQFAICDAATNLRFSFCLASTAGGLTSGIPGMFRRNATPDRYTLIFALIGSVSRVVFSGASMSPYLTAEDAR